MDRVHWYLVACCGLCLFTFVSWFLKLLWPNIVNRCRKFLLYSLAIHRGRYWDSMTRLEASLLLLIILANIALIFAPFSSPDWRQIERTSASLSVFNAIPLWIGGRKGRIIRALNVHESAQGNFHHWVGRLPSIASCNNRTFPQAQGRAARHFWVSCEFMDSLRFQLANTLIQCFGSNLLLVVVSICLARTFMKSAFIPLHVVLANSSAGALLWHTKDLRNKAPFIVTTVTISLWFVFTVYRWFKRYWRPLIGRVRSKLEDRDATKIELALTLPTRVPPGSYFRIFFPANHGYNLIGRPAVALWHPPDAQDPSQQLSVITFLLSRHTFNALDIYRISEGDKVRLEGPFGQDNHLGSYETVMLAAKGIGISGVLAQALDLAERRQHDDRIKSELGELTNKQATLVKDEARARGKAKTQLTQKRRDIAKKIKSLRSKPRFRDATRTVDLYWSLESNSQVEWVAEQLQALQKIDPHNVSLARLQFHIY